MPKKENKPKKEKLVEINTDNNKMGTVILNDGFDIPIKNRNKTINRDKKIKKLAKKIHNELKKDGRRFNMTIDIDFEEIPPSKTIFQEALDIVTEALEQPDNSVIFKHTGLNELKKVIDQANKLQEDRDYIINQYERLTRYRKQLHEADLGERFMLEKEYEMLYQTVQDIEELIQKEMEK